MDHDRVHETDICTWAEQQAAALRGLASRADLPNQLDLPNLIEEIEDLVANQLGSVSSLIRLVLSHALLVAADPDADSVPHWTAEAATFHANLVQRYQPSMRQRVDMDRLWRRALREAQAKLAAYHRDERAVILARVLEQVDPPCPLCVDGLGEICDEDFEFPAAVERLRQIFAIDPAS